MFFHFVLGKLSYYNRNYGDNQSGKEYFHWNLSLGFKF